MTFLSLENTSVTDDGIALLADATNLREVNIISDLLTDRCMETLCALPKLQSLLLHNVPFVTDKGVAALQNRRALRELYLKGTHLSNRGVPFFTHLEGLWSLCLNRTQITDEGVSQMAPLRELSLLDLTGTMVYGYGLCDLPLGPQLDVYLDECPVDDASISAVAGRLTTVKTLSLNGTNVTDECMPALCQLLQLNVLRLNGTSVTDKGIACFAGHSRLEGLHLRGTEVSKQKADWLKAMSPRKLSVYC